MVRVAGPTPHERALREKKSKLLEITREFLKPIGGDRLTDIEHTPTFSLKHHSTIVEEFPILVDVSSNRVNVFHRSYFDEAISLAEKYEEATRESFTVKRNYG